MTAPLRRESGRNRETYTGPTVHCTHWRDQHELDRLHVAVIGGGTALARVVPPVVDQARRVTVFQHDPIWILPTPPLPGLPLLLRRLPSDLLGSLPGSSAPPFPGDHPGPSRPDIGLVLRGVPGAGLVRWCARQALRRSAAANLRAQVGDSWERRQLTPDHSAEVRVHSRYYRSLRQPNCTLISWPVARLAPLGVRTVDGVEHRVDCIIYAEDAS
ncbi:hypothetical protein [Nocardia seriolae]|uniref:Uncharacterized protein n=1 Tax=Nocardia seriolae TaxID=37332 RepID=A0A0B8ND65_9NOCA|nr:hypothetical protein [Nocardia seriolae]MTJ61235.1 hypothetical protein [Nocardia seriolae]MTJ69992.1 hypothetical protein [Nocardia seriolae]MTJ90640.1 hypothetical protein [Nocardia seriolae]MTK34601.1 hypothetical protein [Nocardia seriolae]MTK39212.1 hypothetical protein [Nocardia seriolae]